MGNDKKDNNRETKKIDNLDKSDKSNTNTDIKQIDQK